jgi:hypothetical protein
VDEGSITYEKSAKLTYQEDASIKEQNIRD